MLLWQDCGNFSKNIPSNSPEIISAITCAATCRIVIGCSSFKLDGDNCTLLDGRHLKQPRPNEEFIKIQFDISFPPVNRKWSEWGNFGPCTTSCGPGTRTQTRICDGPEPQYLGSDCSETGTTQSESRTGACYPARCVGSSKLFVGFEGVWGEPFYCLGPHSFVTGFQTRTFVGADNQGLTEIHMFCNDGTILPNRNSSVGPMGPLQTCSAGYNEVKVRMVPWNAGDNSAANCLELKCASDMTWQQSGCSSFGNDEFFACPVGNRICGLQTKVHFEGPDVSGVNDIYVFCCSDVP